MYHFDSKFLLKSTTNLLQVLKARSKKTLPQILLEIEKKKTKIKVGPIFRGK